jgi:hypothetical protein
MKSSVNKRGPSRTDDSSRPRPTARQLSLLGTVVVLAAVLAVFVGRLGSGPGPTLIRGIHGTIAVPQVAGLSPLRRRIVAIAESQIGYRTDPPSTYCNRFSAYWGVGEMGCPRGERAEEWCADFAAWVWRQAGVRFVYGFGSDQINSAAASFYDWGVANGTWHPADSGYRPLPGDVAVYGLDPQTNYAAHVAIVVGQLPGQRGPIAVNGDGDHTGFSVVEAQANEYYADTSPDPSSLSGYVSP